MSFIIPVRSRIANGRHRSIRLGGNLQRRAAPCANGWRGQKRSPSAAISPGRVQAISCATATRSGSSRHFRRGVPYMQRSIEGEVAWVTGGGSGIGQAGAVRLAAAGAKIVLTGRRREALDETAAMIRDKGGEATVAPADMGKRDEVEAVAKRIADEHGRCDILVNSAGINLRNRKWADVDAPGFDSGLDANLSGPFYATAAVLPMMRKQKS